MLLKKIHPVLKGDQFSYQNGHKELAEVDLEGKSHWDAFCLSKVIFHLGMTSNKMMLRAPKNQKKTNNQLRNPHTLPNFKPPKNSHLPFNKTTSCRSWVKKSNGSFQSSAPSQALNTAFRLETLHGQQQLVKKSSVPFRRVFVRKECLGMFWFFSKHSRFLPKK